ncbi:MAG: phosphotransferase [Burkholderiales bacterium PBB4]|nr:MAG: phosphotransferase [Burkholderiales bacterium PBB4]
MLDGGMTHGTPPAEVSLDTTQVCALLRQQHPDLAHLPLQMLDAGFDNCMFRLGEGYSLRFPRRSAAAALVLKEQEWLPKLAPRLALAVPAPLRLGLPGLGYPWHWSVLPWLPGSTADQSPPDAQEAVGLADFLKALHHGVDDPVSPHAPRNPVRGCPLADRQHAVEARLSRLRQHTDAVTLQVDAAWQKALDAPASTQDVWLHGDLHPRNILTQHGKLSAILDWGDLGIGDAATDLASVWMVLDDPTARQRALDRYAPDTHLLARARGWAVSFGSLLLDTGRLDHPQHAQIGAACLRRLSQDYRP